VSGVVLIDVRGRQVNREFHRLCYDGQLWNTIDASEFYNRIPVAQLAQLIVSAGNFVRHLNLRFGSLSLSLSLSMATN